MTDSFWSTMDKLNFYFLWLKTLEKFKKKSVMEFYHFLFCIITLVQFAVYIYSLLLIPQTSIKIKV